jgi:DeoR/GlpR family transcriptional regulator of sugar metabolism
MIVMASRNPAARRHQLRREIALKSTASVAELCKLLNASPATIRRDLDVLQSEGLIVRSYGGASVQPKRPAEQAFAVREQEDVEAKRAIAKSVIDLINPGETVFLNGGSTSLAVARELAISNLKLFVATPGIHIATVIAENENITVCLLGGFVQRNLLVTSGLFTEAMIDQINADIAIIDGDAFDPEQGLSFDSPTDATEARHMLRSSKRWVALVTGTKFHRRARITGLKLSEVTHIVTDVIDPPLEDSLTNLGIEVIHAESETTARA